MRSLERELRLGEFNTKCGHQVSISEVKRIEGKFEGYKRLVIKGEKVNALNQKSKTCYFWTWKELEFELIDAGAEEVFEVEGGIMIYGDFPSFGKIQKALEENEFEILSSGFDRIPTTLKKLNEEQEADVSKLLEKIEDDDDVQNVYHNMD